MRKAAFIAVVFAAAYQTPGMAQTISRVDTQRLAGSEQVQCIGTCYSHTGKASKPATLQCGGYFPSYCYVHCNEKGEPELGCTPH